MKKLLNVDLLELSSFFSKMRKIYRVDLDVKPDLMKPLNFDPYNFMVNSYGKKFRNVLWLFSEAAHEKAKRILYDYLPFAPNNHYAVKVKNFTYEGNIVCAGLLMVQDFRKALRKEIDKFSEQDTNIDLLVLPKAAFDRFGDDLTGENYSKLSDEFDIPVWLG
jgi:hypothetical protein